MDLETHERGIVVDIRFAGPLNKLNFSYRSDPPLETNDIIALLAVGRTPSTTGPLASTRPRRAPTTGHQQQLSAEPSHRACLGPAAEILWSKPHQDRSTAHRHHRGTAGAAYAEQQISTVVTVTYITNLAVTNQQIVRVQWDLNKQWSVVALRDENGAFSVDFQYRKRFN